MKLFRSNAWAVSGVLVTLGALGCGSDQGSSAETASARVTPCDGVTCWDCKPITIKNALRIVCEGETTRDDVPPTYSCGSSGDMSTCPPLLVGGVEIVPDAGATGSLTDAGATGAALDGGAHEGGEPPCDDAGAIVIGDAGAPPAPSPPPPPPAPDAGAPVGYECQSGGTNIHCEGPITCVGGTVLSPCGTCVPVDACDCCGDAGAGLDAGAVPAPGPSPVDAGASLGCSLTQGYWKNHASQWPTTVLSLGGTNYGQAELLAILRTPPKGDASIILVHQLIAAKLNVASGASSGSIGASIASADAWLAANIDADGRVPCGVASSSAAGQQAVTLAAKLDAYNNGKSGVPHCD